MKRLALMMTIGLCATSAIPALAAEMFGPTARTQFENLRDNFGATHIDFGSLGAGTNLTTQLTVANGVSFASNISTFGSPFGPFHVEVVSGQIMGSPCGGCSQDGRVGYEIVFSAPQRAAGLARNWNTTSTTIFYNEAGTSLFEHQNTVNSEYVGYIADSADSATWVKRIQADGPDASRQVGFSDDIMYGTNVPEPATMALLGLSVMALL